MVRSELVARLIVRHPHLYEREAEGSVKSIFVRIAEALTAGDRVKIRDFGTFTLKERAVRRGRNPRTGKAIRIEVKADVRFKPGRTMKARVKRGKIEFGTSTRALLQGS